MFYPITDTNHIAMETRTERAQNIKDITKEEIASNLQVNIEAIKLANESETKEEPWTKVKKGVKHIQKSNSINKTLEDQAKSNMYNELCEDDTEDMDRRSKNNEQHEKKTSE